MKKILTLLALAALLAACAGTSENFRKAKIEVEAGNEEQGLAQLEAELKRDPKDTELRNYYQNAKALAVQRYLALADNARRAGASDRAEQAYGRALQFDPENDRAKAGLDFVRKDREHRALFTEADAAYKSGNIADAQAKLRQILVENPSHREARALQRRIDEQAARDSATPKLNAALQKPVTMEFRDAPLKSVFELISKQTGLSFVFDRDVQPDLKATVFVRDTSIDEVIRLVLVTNQLERKVLNDNTVLVYPNTAAKTRDYKDLVVKSFYLGNADAKQTANMLRSLVKTRDLFVDEKLNLLVMRDTPEAVRVAEKLVANQDKSEPEVMLEVQVLEVGHTDFTALGIQWPGQVALGIKGAAGIPGQAKVNELGSGVLGLTVSDPLFALNMRQQVGRSNILANPRIRIKNREKARIHIGDKVPVITTTAGATGFVSESVNYLDVGLKLEVEPQVFLDDDVGIKVGLEVSSVGDQVKTTSGTIAYKVSTRNTASVLRLRDGETEVLAGLINNEDRRNSSQVPGLANLPVAGRLFQSKEDTVNKTEVVLLITPHVIRNIERPEVKLEEFSSGTEAELGGGGPAPSVPLGPVERPAIPQPTPQPPIPSTLGSPAPAAGPQNTTPYAPR